jgi:parallel beta-helix repeat protein
VKRSTLLVVIIVPVVLAAIIFSWVFSANSSRGQIANGAALPQLTATGASIDETRVQQTLYVNNQAAGASDSNPGTEAQPFRTISRGAKVAQANNEKGIGTKVAIAAGVYRELVSLPQSGKETNAPFILEGASRGSVIVSGSDVWSGWQTIAPNLYQHPWPYSWGLAPYPPGWAGNTVLQDIVRRREMIFVNGHPMMQVLQYSALTDYSFYADETGRQVYLQLGPSVSMDGATVEVSTRAQVLIAQGKKSFVLRNLVFRHGNPAVQDSSIQIADSTNVLIEACTFEWNNWIGLGLTGTSNMTLHNNTASRNGATGFDVYNMRNLVLDTNETSFNNWRGARGDFYGWSVAGSKLGGVHTGLVKTYTATANRARGLWLDFDNTNLTVDGATLVWNFNDGLFIEANAGPILVQNSTMSNNQNAAGIAGANSSDVTLLNNAVIGNGVEQILVTGDLHRTVTNWETNGQQDVQATRWTIQGNTVTSQDVSQALLATPNWQPFLTTLLATNNIWSKPGGQQTFHVGSSWMTFTQWQALVHTDTTSVFNP